MRYSLVLLDFVNIDNMSERGDDIDIDASKVRKEVYPSAPIWFWNDIFYVFQLFIMRLNKNQFELILDFILTIKFYFIKTF